MAKPPKRIVLKFDPALLNGKLADARDNVSAIVLRGDQLWLGGDEGTSIDLMTRDPDGNFGHHERVDLQQPLLTLPAGGEEIDIEGLDVDGGYLWLVGSHSAKRKKAEDGKSDAKNLDRLAIVDLEGNRLTLARVPVTPDPRPQKTQGTLTAARLEGDASQDLLTAALRHDRHLGRFIPGTLADGTVSGIPSKDNGFDVEGLAVSGNRVFLGLRGPVLRGWAILLELRVSDRGEGLLGLEPLGPDGVPYVKHFLQLDGLGIREVSIDGRDLLILAGPTMDLDGPVFIYRWANALDVQGESLTWRKDLQRILAVPFGEGHDHAEGLTIVAHKPLSVLVTFDSPHPSRITGADGSGVVADLFDVDE